MDVLRLFMSFLRGHKLYLGLLILMAIFPFILPQYFIHLLVLVLIWTVGSEGWNVISGYAGQSSFGHAVFFGLAAYITIFLRRYLGLSPWIGLCVSVALSIPIAILIGFPTFRLRGPYFSLASMTFMVIAMTFFLAPQFHTITGGSVGLTVPFGQFGLQDLRFTSSTPYYYIYGAILLASILILRRFEGSKIGYAVKSVREDEDAAATLGVNPLKYKLIALIIGGMLTSVCGVLYVQYIAFIDPYSAFGFATNLQLILVTLLGGIGTVYGPLVGSFVMVPLTEASYLLLGGQHALRLIIYGIVMMLIVLFAPEGVTRLARSLIRKLGKL